MARNEEKAMSMLNRWVAMKAGLLPGGKRKSDVREDNGERRPKLSSTCKTLPEAEKWRNELLKDITKNITLITGPGAADEEVRDINDNINRLLRVKWHWEKRIIELGGTNYMKAAHRIEDAGFEAPNSGYRYFGRAKDLPGVKELFKQTAPKPKRLRGDVYKYVDADYYGYRDDDDGVLVKLEKEMEDQRVATAILEWHEQDAKRRAMGGETHATTQADAPTFIAHVPLPSMQDIEKAVVEKRKAALLEKYASKDLISAEQTTKALSGLTQ